MKKQKLSLPATQATVSRTIGTMISVEKANEIERIARKNKTTISAVFNFFIDEGLSKYE